MTASQKTNFSAALAMNLYNLRRNRNLIQKEAASGINVSQQTYSLLEKGEHNFTDEIIDGICEFFEIGREEFVDMRERISVYNSPYSANTNNTDSQNTNGKVMEEVLSLLTEEVKANREERKYFIELIKTETAARNTEREHFLRLLGKNRE